MATLSIPLRPFSFKTQRKAARFWSHVNITADPNECWEWSRSRANNYGMVHFARASHRAHRLAWLLTNNQTTTNLNILHSCDNPPCCNPNHLRAGTQKENIRECVTKGRYGYAKVLDATKVRMIRNLHAIGSHSIRGLGRLYKVEPSTIRAVLNRKIWKHIE